MSTIRLNLFLFLFAITVFLYGGQFRYFIGVGLSSILNFLLIFIAIILANSKYSNKVRNVFVLVVMYFVFVIALSLLNAVIGGFYNIKSYVMYFAFILLSPLAYISGFNFRLKYKRFYDIKYVFYFSILISILYIYLGFNELFYINKNWAALSIFFVAVLRVVINGMFFNYDKIFFLLYSIFSQFFFNSQGVALASITIFLLSISFNGKGVVTRKALEYIGYCFLFLSATIPFFISWVLSQPLGESISNWWSLVFEERLGSGRLEYWAAVVEMVSVKTFFLGYGLDATIGGITDGYFKNSSTHNLFIEVFLRAGFISYIFIFSIFFVIIRRLSHSRFFNLVPIVISILVLSSVYSLAGFTHWPGTLFVWFILGCLSALSFISINNNF